MKLRLALLIACALQVVACTSSEERAQSYYEHGQKLVAEHDYARASIEFRNAIKIKKDFIAAWRALAQIEETNRHWEGLIPVLRSVVELDPKDVGAKLKLARLLMLANATDEALRLVNAATETDSQNGDALALKALLLFKLKDAPGAVHEAQAALDADPGNSGATIIIAADRMSRGDTKGALQLLDSVSNAKDIGVQLFKLKIFEQTQDLKQAEALLLKLVELYPDEAEFRKQLIRLYIYQHRPEDAEKEQRSIVAARPNDSKAALELVGLLLALKGPDAARQELVSRISAGGEVFPYQMALADFEYAQGNHKESVGLLERLISAGSRDQALAAQTKLAEINLREKKVDAAEALVSDILKKDSRSTNGLKLRASIRMDRGELEGAINDLRQALNDQPRSAELMLLLATAYERSGSIELAEKQLADATRASNYAPSVGLSYVAFLQRRGGAARAEEVVIELASRWPKNIQILSMLAQIRLARENWIGAQEVAEIIRKIGNDRGVADQILGAALIGRNKYDESIEVFQNAYSAAPSAAQPMFSLVRAFVRAQKTDRAMAFLQSVLKANPTNAEALVLLGSIQLSAKAPDEAVKSFKAAIEKQPKDIIGYRALADLYSSQNKVDDALKVIEAGLRELPDNSVLHLIRAGVLERNRDYAGAISEYEYMLAKEPSSLIAANNLASLLSDYRTDKASLEKARSLAASLRKSPVPQFKDTLGWVSYREGDYKVAVSLLEEAAAALPNRPLVSYHLGMSYIAAGQLEKASEQLKMALNRAPDNELKEKIQAALKRTGT